MNGVCAVVFDFIGGIGCIGLLHCCQFMALSMSLRICMFCGLPLTFRLRETMPPLVGVVLHKYALKLAWRPPISPGNTPV